MHIVFFTKGTQIIHLIYPVERKDEKSCLLDTVGHGIIGTSYCAIWLMNYDELTIKSETDFYQFCKQPEFTYVDNLDLDNQINILYQNVISRLSTINKCECRRAILNSDLPLFPLFIPDVRFDIIEKILLEIEPTHYAQYIWKLNDEVLNAKKILMRSNSQDTIAELESFDYPMRTRLIKYFQRTKNNKVYVSDTIISECPHNYYMPGEKPKKWLVVYYPHKCFLCLRYNYKFSRTCNGDDYIIQTESEERIQRGVFLCDKCFELHADKFKIKKIIKKYGDSERIQRPLSSIPNFFEFYTRVPSQLIRQKRCHTIFICFIFLYFPIPNDISRYIISTMYWCNNIIDIAEIKFDDSGINYITDFNTAMPKLTSIL